MSILLRWRREVAGCTAAILLLRHWLLAIQPDASKADTVALSQHCSRAQAQNSMASNYPVHVSQCNAGQHVNIADGFSGSNCSFHISTYSTAFLMQKLPVFMMRAS